MRIRALLGVLMLPIATAKITSAQEFGKRALYVDDGLQHFAIACHPHKMLLPAGYMTSLPIGFQPYPGSTVDEDPRPSAFRRLGIYSAEFGLGVVGTGVALGAAIGIGYGVGYLAGYLAGERNKYEAQRAAGSTGGVLTYLLAYPFFSAGGAYLGGKLFRQKGSFWNAYIGANIAGAIGLLVPVAISFCPCGCESGVGFAILFLSPPALGPALGAALGYNLRR